MLAVCSLFFIIADIITDEICLPKVKLHTNIT